MLTVDLQMLRGTDSGLGNDEVWMDVVLVLALGRSANRMRPGWDNVTVDPQMHWRTDEAWMDVTMVLAHGCSGERMRPG